VIAGRSTGLTAGLAEAFWRALDSVLNLGEVQSQTTAAVTSSRPIPNPILKSLCIVTTTKTPGNPPAADKNRGLNIYDERILEHLT